MAILDDSELLRRLIAFDTISCRSNLPLADFVCDYLDRSGVQVERVASPDGQKTNLVITIGAGGGAHPNGKRHGLILSGHTDVVPADEPEWQSDPFELTEAEGRYVGRGVCDMKGFVALAVNAAARLEPRSLRHPLVLLFTYDEEIGTLGARRLVEQWAEPARLPRHAVIGEPTGFEVVRMHKGHLTLRISLAGRSAHSGYPHLGVNAIEAGGRAIRALAELRAELETERGDVSLHFPDAPYASLNVATIRGGTAVNIIPDRCVIEVGVRLLPGMEGHAVAARIEDVLAATLPDGPPPVEVVSETPPMLLAEQALVYRVLTETLGSRRPSAVSFATDAGWLQRLGIDCAVCGPGDIEVAHRANEWLAIEEFGAGREHLEALVHRFCVTAPDAR